MEHMSERREEKVKKRILVLANFDVGLYHFRRKLLETMLKSGHEVYISLPNGEFVEPLVNMGCKFIDTPVDRRGINPLKDLKLFLRYLQLVERVKPDLTVTYTIKPNIYGGIACRMKKLPYAANITGLGTAFQKKGLLRSLIVRLCKSALRKAKVVFFENEGNRQTFLDFGICKEDVCVRLNGAGVDLEHFTYLSYPKEETVHFLFIGRVMREKGVDELFAAMQKLRADGENCVLDMLGSFEENYSQKIGQYQAEGWLNYYGQQKDVRPFIEKAHCFVLPSWHEGMANTNLECAASGRPVITSNIPGCKEAVIDGVSGFLCESKNTACLYEVMKRFTALSAEERSRMGISGREHMKNVFDKIKVVDETMKGLGI